ncbi:sensor histidine kinase [Streptomyces tagetis]|uniref:histidine kinase n=1 Tax=Streptomyces tagetis TaxID=2820809 RepID=A0A941B0C1_9ACTN|nr:HAMP domain-containing sensor histidine kinase [Streptomyces sp. RG38]MBQ0826556.1 HAMP domain-containing histidine kinase [Streptomyces sp. RG38]
MTTAPRGATAVRRRALVSFLLLAALLLLATGIPLGFNQAMNHAHQAVARQVAEATALAVTAPAGTGGPAGAGWRARADAYVREHRATVVLLDARGRQVYATGPDTGAVDSAAGRAALERALGGRSAVPPDHRFRFGARPLLLAEPVLRDGEPVGAVVTVTPRPPLGPSEGAGVLLLMGVGVAALVGAVCAGAPLARWSLRSVGRPRRADRRLSQDEYAALERAGLGPVELHELSTTGQAVTDHLVTALEAQRGFVADVSHQMRNPLTALLLRVEALEPLVPPEGRRYLESAVAEADRLGRVLDELLALANAMAGDLGTAPIEVRAVVEARAQAWSERAARADVTIVVHGRRAAVRGLPGALDQVLDILLDNAIGFSPPGGRVTVRVRSDETRVYVEVEDEGPGMPDADKGRATDRFWRGRRQPARRQGSGLGLAIASALLSAGDGRLTLEDARPHGLLARAILPRLLPASAVKRPVSAPSGPDGDGPAPTEVTSTARRLPDRPD